MTESTSSAPTAEQLARIARIRERRAGATPAAATSSVEFAPPTTPRTAPPVGRSTDHSPGEPGGGVTAPSVASRPSGAAPRRRRRRHPAQGGRIAAAGLGATTMFGIVGLLGFLNPVGASEGTDQPVEPLEAPSMPVMAPIEVVIHYAPTASAPAVGAAAPTAGVPAVAQPTVASSVAPSAPVVLTATPVVRTVTVEAPPAPAAPAASAQPAPRATTSGSN